MVWAVGSHPQGRGFGSRLRSVCLFALWLVGWWFLPTDQRQRIKLVCIFKLSIVCELVCACVPSSGLAPGVPWVFWDRIQAFCDPLQDQRHKKLINECHQYIGVVHKTRREWTIIATWPGSVFLSFFTLTIKLGRLSENHCNHCNYSWPSVLSRNSLSQYTSCSALLPVMCYL